MISSIRKAVPFINVKVIFEKFYRNGRVTGTVKVQNIKNYSNRKFLNRHRIHFEKKKFNFKNTVFDYVIRYEAIKKLNKIYKLFKSRKV